MGSCLWLSPNWQEAHGIFDANLTSQSSAMGNPGLQIRVTSLSLVFYVEGWCCFMWSFGGLILMDRDFRRNGGDPVPPEKGNKKDSFPVLQQGECPVGCLASGFPICLVLDVALFSALVAVNP